MKQQSLQENYGLSLWIESKSSMMQNRQTILSKINNISLERVKDFQMKTELKDQTKKK